MKFFNCKGCLPAMEYEKIRLLKQSEKSTIHLVRAKDGEQIFIRKELRGLLPVYQTLLDCPHPCLPKLYEVSLTEASTVVVEQYIDGQPLGTVELSKKQFLNVVRELCSALELLHGKGIIHRDIKPSNILLTGDGKVYLIDFDAARTSRNDAEQDTILLGTRGFAPPEQYGFSQTDERADVYALGVTLNQLLNEDIQSPRYKRIIRKCMNLDPGKRYQSVKQVRQAFFCAKRYVLCSFAALVLIVLAGCGVLYLSPFRESARTGVENGEGNSLTVLPVPGTPHWDGETGTAVWENVPESGIGDEVQFYLRLYRRDTETPPDPGDDDWYFEQKVRIGGSYRDVEIQSYNLTPVLAENGLYYFTMASVGDGIRYTDSPFVVSDVFEYTGMDAPHLPSPTGLTWALYEIDNTRKYYAIWDNIGDYEDGDWFNVTVYDNTGAYVMNNTWSKSQIVQKGLGGISVPAEFLIAGPDKAYRFTVQAISSRPNEYSASPMPDPAPEEYYSPWLDFDSQSGQ